MDATEGDDATTALYHDGSVQIIFSPGFHSTECCLWWGLLMVALVYAFLRRRTVSNNKSWFISAGLLMVILLNSLQTSAFVVFAQHSISVLYLANVFLFHASRSTFVVVLLAMAAQGDLGQHESVMKVAFVTMLAAGLVLDYMCFLDINSAAIFFWWIVRVGLAFFAYKLAKGCASQTAPGQDKHQVKGGREGRCSGFAVCVVVGVVVCATIGMTVGVVVGVAVGVAVGNLGDKAGNFFMGIDINFESLEDILSVGMSAGVEIGVGIGVIIGVMVGLTTLLGFYMMLIFRRRLSIAVFGLFVFSSMGAAASGYQSSSIPYQLFLFVCHFVFVIHVARTAQVTGTTQQQSVAMAAKNGKEKAS